MRVTLALIDHDEDSEDFEEFIAANLPIGHRVTVEWDGMFAYADVLTVEMEV
jgi:hypothetical protein